MLVFSEAKLDGRNAFSHHWFYISERYSIAGNLSDDHKWK